MHIAIALLRHLFLPAVFWIAVISWARTYQHTQDTPETTYILVAIFAACWLLRSVLLCAIWPRANGMLYAAGQLVGLALFLYWPTIVPDGSLIITVDGPAYGLPPETPYTDSLINSVILANRFLPMILIASAAALALGSIVTFARRSAPPPVGPITAKPDKPVTPQAPSPAPAAKPARTGYTEIHDNPLDAFR